MAIGRRAANLAGGAVLGGFGLLSGELRSLRRLRRIDGLREEAEHLREDVRAFVAMMRAAPPAGMELEFEFGRPDREVAVEVGNLRYIASQNWPFPHSLMLGFHADYAGGEIVPQPEEIEDARWFRVDALPPLPARGSIARYLIDLHLARRSGDVEPVLPG